MRSDLVAHAYCLSLDADDGDLDERTIGKKGDRKASVAAWIVYEVPSVTTLITGDTPSSRHVQVALPSLVLPFSNKQACKEALKMCLEDSAKGVRNGNWDTNAVSMVLPSMEPYMNKSGKVGLNFQGRGRLPSNKNMQLSVPMMANDEDGGASSIRSCVRPGTPKAILSRMDFPKSLGSCSTRPMCSRSHLTLSSLRSTWSNVMDPARGS